MKAKKKIPVYVVLTLFALLWVFPLYAAIQKSFDVNGFGNYYAVLTNRQINYIKVVSNSLMVAVFTALIVVAVTSIASYAFSKMNFRGKNVIYYLILACLAVPVASVSVPLFFTINKMHLIDNIVGVILPLVAFNAPLMLIMVKNYFDGIPNEIIEAARIDGCRDFRIYSTILMPLSMPIIANVAVLTFVYSWNDFLLPLLVLRSNDRFTVTLAAQAIMQTTYQSPSAVAQIYAALILMTVPSVIIYLFSQKYLQSGIVAGSVKS